MLVLAFIVRTTCPNVFESGVRDAVSTMKRQFDLGVGQVALMWEQACKFAAEETTTNWEYVCTAEKGDRFGCCGTHCSR